jgi:hypothetical protein
MRVLKSMAFAIAAALPGASPATAAIFSFEFAFPLPGIAEIPGSTYLADNQFVMTEVRIPVSTRLSLYRLRQADSDNLLPGFAPPGSDVDLVLGPNRFEIDDQAFDFAGQLVSTFTYQGGMLNSLGMVFDDGGDVFTYYADLPFSFYVDSSATYDGIGPYVGSSDIVYFTLPGNSGLYRLQAAVPEPAAWTLMIGGFGLAGASLRLRRRGRTMPGLRKA